MKCVELIQKLSLPRGFVKVPSASSISYVPQSPIGVLDAACLSYITYGRRGLNTPYEVDTCTLFGWLLCIVT
ncbi:hypothetical protein KY284_020233 [Solanum tuberosum]|nr:hypothetical protein KY284_020233 [Solanum tuberosum]